MVFTTMTEPPHRPAGGESGQSPYISRCWPIVVRREDRAYRQGFSAQLAGNLEALCSPPDNACPAGEAQDSPVPHRAQPAMDASAVRHPGRDVHFIQRQAEYFGSDTPFSRTPKLPQHNCARQVSQGKCTSGRKVMSKVSIPRPRRQNNARQAAPRPNQEHAHPGWLHKAPATA